MTSKQVNRLLLAGLLLATVGLFGGTYLAYSTLQKYSKDIVSKRADVIKLEQQQTSLTRARKDVQTYKPLADIAKSIVPQDKNQAQTVREIVGIASKNGISLGSITFPTSTLGDTPAGGTSTTAKPVAGTDSALSQLAPVLSIPGVYSLEIIVTSNTDAPVSYGKFLTFLDDLEHNRRTALVSNISINPDKINRNNIAFTLTLDEYIKP